MAVSRTTDYWTSRMDGNDPTIPTGTQNLAFTGSAGEASGKNWKIGGDVATNGYYTLGDPLTTDCTLWIAFSYTQSIYIPVDGTIIAEIDNGTF